MKELIGKLSRGVIEYEQPVVEASVSHIERIIKDSDIYNGAFSVFCENDAELKGIVYSSCEMVRIEDNQFIGRENIIKYHVEVSKCDCDKAIEGCFDIVSNGGEISIPYRFTIKKDILECGSEEVQNLFHFTNLVQTKYDEAVKLFADHGFSDCLLKDNLCYQALYDGLIKGRNINNSLEEFLIGVSKKQRIEFTLLDTSREYDSLDKDYGDIILLSKDGWGYSELNINVQGDFIDNYKEHLTTEDFAGNNYEFSFSIITDKLHDGMNYGTIIFNTPFQKLEFQISVDNTHPREAGYIEKKKCLAKLNSMYLNFRMRKYGVNDWTEDSLKAIERLRSIDDSSAFVKLVQAQIYLSKSMDEQASWLLGNVAEEILDRREENIELYAYYLYVRTLQKRDMEMSDDVLRKVKHYYENGYDSWKLLWILFYLDNAYENNKSLKLARIKEQYVQGCTSPLMYFEALNAFNRQPVLLRVLNDFELQVLIFGCKYEGINLKLALQMADIAMLEKSFRPLVFKILVSLYDRFENKEILTTICSLLIRGNKSDNKYFKWYRLGIEAELKLAKLYEYYIFSMDDTTDDVIFPETLLMYFAYNGEMLREKQEVLYANILENSAEIPEVIDKYKDGIEKFGIDQIMKGRINDHLAVIYDYVIKESLIDIELGSKLVPIMNTYKVECFNDNICEVIVHHKELVLEEKYPVRNGQAYIQIYTEDPAIIFVDNNGNRFSKTINYTIKQLYINKEYMDLCAEMDINNKYLSANIAEKLLKYHCTNSKAVNLFKKIMSIDEFRSSYKTQIMGDIIDFYYVNYDGDELDNYLEHINIEYMDRQTRMKTLEIMLLRGVNERASTMIDKYGIMGIDARRLAKYCSRKLVLEEVQFDTQLMNICIYILKMGKYNEPILRYICNYFNGTTKEMLEIWKKCNAYEIESREFEERLLAQMLFTRTQLSSINEVYKSYFSHGASTEMKNAFLFYEVYLYIIKEQPVSGDIFNYLGMELEHRNSLNDMCEAAYVKYFSENQANDEQLKLCGNLIEHLVSDGIMFDFYKKYSDLITLPSEVMENAVVEYRTTPDKKVFIHYLLSGDDSTDKEYITEEMQQVFAGVYTKKILMFYGESLMYYVTEDSVDSGKLTESSKYTASEGTLNEEETRFAKLNGIIVCKEMKEESTIRNMMKAYYVENELTKTLFK